MKIKPENLQKYQEKYAGVDLLEVDVRTVAKPSELSFLHISISKEIYEIHQLLEVNPSSGRGARIPQLYSIDRLVLMKIGQSRTQQNIKLEKRLETNIKLLLEYQQTIKTLKTHLGREKFSEITGIQLQEKS